jgi:para-aminobenzoate synthetase component 1
LPPLRGLTPNFTPEGYKAAVAAAREFILSGDIYEVNVSQRFTLPCDGRLDDLYLRLREYNPAPYGAFISSPRTTILCSSPELFLRLEGGRVVTRPIKGTAKRREGLFEDDDAARALALSEKDNAELAMVVDLERNDLGRVCRFGTVKVAERARVETFARVHHLVSTIEGTLRGAVTLADLFRATFPGGSITGAPKIRAMQIIDELEPCRRGVYTGSIGYILPGGRAQFNIAIRTIVHEEGRLAVQVGGAVTADSDPDAEYEETLTKAEALFAALGDGRAELSRAGRGRDVS